MVEYYELYNINNTTSKTSGFESIGSNQRLWDWYLLLPHWAHSIKEKEQTRVVSESGWHVWVKRWDNTNAFHGWVKCQPSQTPVRTALL